MIKAVLFDADGVLINGKKFKDVRAQELKSDPEVEKAFFTGVFQECLVGKADLKESIAPHLADFGWQGTVDEFLDYWFKAEHSLNEDLVNYVQKLRSSGITVALATNQEKYRTQYMLEHMGFAGMFDRIYASAHLGHKKPAREFFHHLVTDLDLPKDAILFWDDDEANIAGAMEYGIHAEFYENDAHFFDTMKSKYGLALR